MLPLSIQKRLANPSQLERQFLNYLRMANAPIDQSKTISYEVLYHGLSVAGQTQSDFFTGQLTQNQTNIRGSFVRPQSEHFLIYGIRGYQAIAEEVVNFNVPWKKGFTSTDATADTPEGTLVNAQMSIEVNSVRMSKYIPLTEFDNELTTGTRGTILLDQPILWQGQTSMKLVCQSNDPATTFLENQYLRFDLLGLGLI